MSSETQMFLNAADRTLVIRTDFSDADAWADVSAAIAAPVGEFRAYVQPVDDRRFEGMTVEDLLALAPVGERSPRFVFVADTDALRRADHPVLVVGLAGDSRGRTFRVIPSEAWGVENNLSLANMDWDDFAGNVDGDGVFRGFPE